MRLAGQIKMGFYPTPSVLIPRIKSFLRFPMRGKASVLDPCCGEGEALRDLVTDNNAVSYGIELDRARASGAKHNLDHVITGDYRQTRISNQSFSLILNNPPFDYDTSSDRKEFIFLRDTVKYLQAKGILVYIIPQHRLGRKIAKILSLRFEQIRIFRFPDPEYQSFKQIVVFAVKKDTPKEDIAIYQGLLTVANQDLPELPLCSEAIYEVPESKAISVFKSTIIDLVELQKSLGKSSVWSRLNNITSTHANQIAKKPPLPLRTGHLALVLASGYLDGEVGEGENLHIVKGRVFKEIKENTKTSDKEVVHKKTDVIRISIKTLQPNGEIKVLM